MRGGPGGCGSGRGSESPPLNGHAPTQDKHCFPIILGPSNSSHPAHSPSSVLLSPTASIASGPAPPPRLAPQGAASQTDLIPLLRPHSYPDLIPHLLPRPAPSPGSRLMLDYSPVTGLRLRPSVHGLLNPNSSGLEPRRDTWSVG